MAAKRLLSTRLGLERMRILIVEDDLPVASFIQKGLQVEYEAVECVADGAKAQSLLGKTEIDLLILDIGLPNVDGFDILKRLRASNPLLPVLMLSALSRVEDRILGLDMGADDYRAKPFPFRELAARVRALLRCRGCANPAKLAMADLEMDWTGRHAVRAGRRIDLSSREFALLAYLLRNPGRCVSRASIMERAWNLPFDPSTNIVDVYINYLRAKIDKDFAPKLIHTVRGAGYRMSAAPRDE